MDGKDRIIVALDTDKPEEALPLVGKLSPHVGGIKVGLEFITSIVVQLATAESEVEASFKLAKIRTLFDMLHGKIFWDGKFDDIPNTIAGASKALTKLNVRMFNVHASAGIDSMMEAVANKGQSLVLAVTVLTSREENDGNLTFGGPTKAKVLQFAREAKLAGCDGIVCSPQELMLLGKRKELRGLLKVTPGIRAADAKPDDQKRTMTATEAVKAGADYVVIGRPITAAPDPVEAAKKFAKEIDDALFPL
ncbi:MAG: orotidine-5'-phosphate decarboxylase [Candidatus Parcubacteria bacterium]|nr:orotidine-5'-phosphate decarboxylase [Candidatus Parcubacteria bacterium]